MKNILLLLLLLPLFTFSQVKFLKIHDKGSNKVFHIKDNKRVKIKTIDGDKLIGKIKILDDNTISIDDEKILLSDIDFIKTRSLGSTVAATVIIIVGAALVVVSTIAIIIDINAAAILFGTGTVMTSTGILLPNFSKKYKQSKYDFSIDLSVAKSLDSNLQKENATK